MFWDTAPKTFRKSSFMMLVVTRIFVRWPLVVGLGVVPPRDGRNNIVRPGYRIRPEPKSWRLAMDLGVNDSRSPPGSSIKTSVVTVLVLNPQFQKLGLPSSETVVRSGEVASKDVRFLLRGCRRKPSVKWPQLLREDFCRGNTIQTSHSLYVPLKNYSILMYSLYYVCTLHWRSHATIWCQNPNPPREIAPSHPEATIS